MDPSSVSVIQEAVRTRLRDEAIERSIGRTVRRRGLVFSDYIKVMSDLRELAKEMKRSVDEVAESLLEDQDEHC